MVRDFKDLEVWKKAIEIGNDVYRITKGFPRDEIYGLTSQLRRAVVSISSNVAEGCGRRTSKNFVGFLHIAMGSIREVESQLIFAEGLGYLSEDELKRLSVELDKLGRMLNGFIGYVSGMGVR